MIKSVDVYWNRANGQGHTSFNKAREFLFQEGLLFLLDKDKQIITAISPTQFLWVDINR